MPGILGATACEACATAKRKCGKQKPHCFRCKRRDIECTYPSSKPSCFVLCEGENIFSVGNDIVPQSASPPSSCSLDTLIAGVSGYNSSPGLELSGFSTGLVEHQLASSWFASVETWKIYRFPQGERNTFNAPDTKRHTAKVLQWLTQWVNEGSNPFIHSRLYQTRFPRSIQDAYTALHCYLHKTAKNEQIIFQIIEDRAKSLLSEHGNLPGSLRPESVRLSVSSLDALEHLARVQALLVYQIIGLYDGNIRLRHLAESNIPVLDSWLHQMVQHASQAVYLGSSISSSARDQTAVGLSMSDIAHSDNQLWYSWILAESIRRTWLVASGMQGIYLAIQQGGKCPACLGGMMFTTRQGVWEANSAPVWEKLCLEVNVGLLHLAESDQLFTQAEPGDVNEFSKVMLEIVFGREKVQRWSGPLED